MDDSWLHSLSGLSSVVNGEQVQVARAVDDGNIWGQLLVVLLLLLVNGFFAAAEMSVVSINENKIIGLADDGDSKARLLLRYIDDSGNFLSTIQVGITFAGFLSSAMASDSFADRLAWLIQPGAPNELVYSLSVVLVTLLTSFLSIVFGEMIPKHMALSNPEKYSMGVVRIIRGFEVAFKPITILITWTVDLFLKLFRIDVDANRDSVTEEEIRVLLDQGKRAGSIEDAESQMIVNIFDFDDKEVSEIMTHRTHVTALDIEMTLDEVVEEVINSRYSRIPVFEGDIDNIVGILHVKDLLVYLTTSFRVQSTDETSSGFDFNDIIRDPYWVPESKRSNELLQEMQQDRVSIAVVVDEYGGTAGVVTIEDLLEEIVGNIQDEYDEDDYGIVRISKGKYQVSGLTSPEDINKVVTQAYFPDEDEDESDYDTIAGLVLSLLGRIPDEDEHPEIRYKNMIFKVLSMDERRIDRLELVITKSKRMYIEDERQKEEERKREEEEERERQRKASYGNRNGDAFEDDEDDDWDDYEEDDDYQVDFDRAKEEEDRDEDVSSDSDNDDKDKSRARRKREEDILKGEVIELLKRDRNEYKNND